MTYEALAHAVMERTPKDEHLDYCVADPAIWGDRTHHKDSIHGESGAETMGTIWKKFTGLVKADNNRIVGWGRMRIMMTPNAEGISKITCGPNCKDSIRTIPTLIHDDTDVEDLNTDGEDHAADDWRYAAMSRPVETEREKPKPAERSFDYYEQLAEERDRRLKANQKIW